MSRRSFVETSPTVLSLSRPATLFISLLLAFAGFGKGMAWSYEMNGVMYDKATKDVLRNTRVMIGAQLVNTDENGWYSVVIRGVTCDRGSREEMDRCNEEAFGQLVVRRLFTEASEIIRTYWKDFACVDKLSKNPPCFLSRRDLFIP